jgi:hypothetical protein
MHLSLKKINFKIFHFLYQINYFLTIFFFYFFFLLFLIKEKNQNLFPILYHINHFLLIFQKKKKSYQKVFSFGQEERKKILELELVIFIMTTFGTSE